ncbi:MAG: MFS transporter [Eubacteriaceae bacterium]|nr:MFS transporter [Eubacteriaceae bacterium]
MSDQAQQEQTDQQKRLPWIFFIYAISGSFNTVVAMQYLSIFVTEYTGITAASLASVLTVARFLDLGVSLFSGAIVQKSNTKTGAFRPWVLFCPLVTWAGCVICFINPNLSAGVKLMFIAVGYCMTHFPMNFLTVAQNGLQTKVAGSNPEARLAIASRRIQGMQFARIITSAATLPLINTFMATDLPLNAYLIVTILFGVISFAGAFLIYAQTKDYDLYDPNAKSAGSAASVSIITMYTQALKNPTVVLLMVVDILRMVAMQTVASCAAYYYRYSGGDMNYMTVAGVAAGFVGFFSALLATPVARKIGKKMSSIVSGFTAGGIYVFMGLFCDGNPLLYIILTSAITIGLAVVGAWGVNLYLDAAEIQLYETGIDNRPFIMSLQNVPIKLGFIASGPALAWLLAQARYEAGVMPDTAVFVRYLGIVPAILYAISSVLVMVGYRVDEARAAECAELNAKAMAEKAAN